MATEDTSLPVEGFNALDREAATVAAAACLPVARWVREVVDGRPYADWAALEDNAARAASDLADDELASALAGHPRIGERASSPEHQAEFSASEQSGVDLGAGDTAARLLQGNAAYEQRFDRVFIIRAAGRSSEEILAELERRLGSDDHTERTETVQQLREIALLRLKQVAT